MPGARRKALGLSALALALGGSPPVTACELPEEGSAPYRRLVSRVKYLPEIEEWAARMARERATVQYVLHLDAPQRLDGRCHWLVEVRAADRSWKRFLVPADGGAAFAQESVPAAASLSREAR